jgi:hypothetical protein
MIKVITFFLIGMLILAIFGRFRFPRGKLRGSRPRLNQVAKCADCGRPVIGTKPCPCQAKDG